MSKVVYLARIDLRIGYYGAAEGMLENYDDDSDLRPADL